MAVFSNLELVYPLAGKKTLTARMEERRIARADSESNAFLPLMQEILRKIVNLRSLNLEDRFGVSVSGGILVPDSPNGFKFASIQPIVPEPESSPWYKLIDADSFIRAMLDAKGLKPTSVIQGQDLIAKATSGWHGQPLPADQTKKFADAWDNADAATRVKLWESLVDLLLASLAFLTGGNTTVKGIKVLYIPVQSSLVVSAWILNELQPELTTNQPEWRFYPQVFNKILTHYGYIKATPGVQNSINLQVDGTTIVPAPDHVDQADSPDDDINPGIAEPGA
jgi:hypothetical protein